MDAGRVSDFSIERILSPQLGPRPDGYHRGVLRVDSVTVRPPAPAQVPMQVMGCQPCSCFGEDWYPFYRAAFQHHNFYPNYGIYAHFSQNSADAQPVATYSGYPPAAVTPPQPQPLQKLRVRTVFTDSQIKQLEALFEITDYPAVETRAELARRAGLSEETVRVWFKNRRARRKRQ